jgi:very-short-patch-repair endonuclease
LAAAILACGSGAVISHRSAAALLGLVDRGPVTIDVIAPAKRGAKIDGIKAHKAPLPAADERESVAGIPCTSPARTLVDLVGICGERTLRGAFETAAYRKMLDLDAIEAVMSRRRLVGVSILRALIAEWRSATKRHPTPPVLRSPFEARVLPLLSQTSLPAPKVNAPVTTPGGVLEVDLLWPDHRLAVELDSRRHHGTDLAFERDRWRDRELMRAGFATLRPTWHQVEHEPTAVVAAIAARLTG